MTFSDRFAGLKRMAKLCARHAVAQRAITSQRAVSSSVRAVTTNTASRLAQSFTAASWTSLTCSQASAFS